MKKSKVAKTGEPSAKRPSIGVQPITGLAALLAGSGVSTTEFFETYWEQRPLVARGVSNRANVTFDVETVFERLAAEESPQFFGPHINAVRFVDGKRVDCNPSPADGDGADEQEDDGEEDDAGSESSSSSVAPLVQAEPGLARAIYNTGATLQAHQPQHYNSALQTLMADLEAEFNCLFGANAYLTPPNSQGLAPHHDDIEAFILQTHGVKAWKLYPPLTMLPRDYSSDLRHCDIGSPCMEVVLQTGDLLYFPRGMIHEAVTAAVPSAHVTLSTYQHMAWVDLLKTALPLAVDFLASTNVALRRGIPVGFARQFGAGAGSPQPAGAARITAAELSSLIAQEVVPVLAAAVGHVLDDTADKFCLDFAVARLPPQGVQVAGSLPKKVKSVTSVNPSFVRLQIEPAADVVTVYNALHNSVEHHMMGGADLLDDATVLRLPVELLVPLQTLLRAWPAPVTVASLGPCAPGGVAEFLGLLSEFKILAAAH